MEYILRTTRHRNMVRRSDDLDYILNEYKDRCDRFPRERFEVVDAYGEVIDADNIKTGRPIGEPSTISESVSEVAGEEVHTDFRSDAESSTDSVN